MTVVELAGAPGSGKTVIARRLVAELRGAGVDAVDASLPPGAGWRRARRLTVKARAVVVAGAVHRRGALRVLRAARRSGMPAREMVARTANLLAAATAASVRAGRVVVLDQGIVQELASVAVTGDCRRVAEELGGLGAGPDVVVVVEAPADLAAGRLRARAGRQSRVELVEPAGLAEEVARWATLVDDALATWTRCAARRPHRYRVRNDGAPADVDLSPVVRALTRG